MSKRFTETGKWDDPWFVRLHPLKKLLWLYLCDRCDAAGVIDFCPEVAAVPCHDDRLTDRSLEEFGDRIEKLPNGKWRIVKFLAFQYGTIDEACPAHRPVIRLIHQYGIKYPINTLSNRVPDRVKEKNRDKEKEKEEGYKGRSRPMTKYGIPLPEGCSFGRYNNDVLDPYGRTMDVNDVRKAARKNGLIQETP